MKRSGIQEQSHLRCPGLHFETVQVFFLKLIHNTVGWGERREPQQVNSDVGVHFIHPNLQLPWIPLRFIQAT